MRAAVLGVPQKRTANLLEALALFLPVVAFQRFSIVYITGFFELAAQRHCAYVPLQDGKPKTVTGLLAARHRKTCSTKRALQFVKVPAQKPALGSLRFLRLLQQIQNRLIHDCNEQSLDSFSLEFAGLRFACLRILLFRLTKRCCRFFANGYRCLVSDVLALA